VGVLTSALAPHLIVRYEGETTQPNTNTQTLDSLNPATTLYINSSHRYEETFTAARSGRLEFFLRPTFQVSSFSGGITLELYGPGPAAAPPVTPPASPELSPFIRFTPRWGQALLAGVVQPNGYTVFVSPRLARGQTRASATFLTPEERDFVVAVANARRRTCFKAFAAGLGNVVRGEKGTIDEGEVLVDVFLDRPALTLVAMAVLKSCLDAVSEALGEAGISALAPGARAAARPRCRTGATRLQLLVDRPSRTVVYRGRRLSRRQAARQLRVSCRLGRGRLTVGVRTRSRRTDLRSVLGPHLQVGLYRSPAATGDGTVRAAFRR
jgi:hypothetical protein